MFWKTNEYVTSSIDTVLTITDDEISTIQPYIEDDFTLSTKQSVIKLRNNEEYIVNHHYLSLTKNKNTYNIKGFYNGNQDMGGS